MRRVRDGCNRARNRARPKKHRASAGPCGHAPVPVSSGRCSDTRRSARRRHARARGEARSRHVHCCDGVAERRGIQADRVRIQRDGRRIVAARAWLDRKLPCIVARSVSRQIDGGALPVSVIAHRPGELPAVASRQLPPGSCLQTWPRSTGLFPWLCFIVGSVIWVVRASQPVRFLLSRSSRSRARWRRVFSPVPPAPQSMG